MAEETTSVPAALNLVDVIIAGGKFQTNFLASSPETIESTQVGRIFQLDKWRGHEEEEGGGGGEMVSMRFTIDDGT